MLRRAALVLVMGFTTMASAERVIKTGIQSDFEPIIGYERVQKLYPTVHTKDRLTYGARAWLGFQFIAVETEYLTAKDTETFTSPDRSYTDTDQKVKAGLRSQIRLASMLSFLLRAGAQAKQNTHEETISGVTTSTANPWVYHPYAGAGLNIRLMNHVHFTAEVVTVFAKYPTNWTDHEYQATAGISIHFP